MHDHAHTGCGRQRSNYVRQSGELYRGREPEFIPPSSECSCASGCSFSCGLVFFFIATSATDYHDFCRSHQYQDEYDINISDHI
jgi:hypothetical protein